MFGNMHKLLAGRRDAWRLPFIVSSYRVSRRVVMSQTCDKGANWPHPKSLLTRVQTRWAPARGEVEAALPKMKPPRPNTTDQMTPPVAMTIRNARHGMRFNPARNAANIRSNATKRPRNTTLAPCHFSELEIDRFVMAITAAEAIVRHTTPHEIERHFAVEQKRAPLCVSSLSSCPPRLS